MRTRTLLLLAVACGLAILLAGGIQLYRISNQPRPVAPMHVGDGGVAGDARITVDSVTTTGEQLVVAVTLSGVDDPIGIGGFRLRAPNRLVAPDPVATTCVAFTTTPVACRLVFPTVGLQGVDRQLVFKRAEEQLRWVLAEG